MLNSLQNVNLLQKATAKWWRQRRADLQGLQKINSEKFYELVLYGLSEFRMTDDCASTAEELPLRYLEDIENLCEMASKSDIKQCVAAICQVLAICISIINEGRLIPAQGPLTIKIKAFGNLDDLQNSLWNCFEEYGTALCKNVLDIWNNLNEVQLPDTNTSIEVCNDKTIAGGCFSGNSQQINIFDASGKSAELLAKKLLENNG